MTSETEERKPNVLDQLPSIEDVQKRMNVLRREYDQLNVLLTSLRRIKKEFRFEGDERDFLLTKRVIRALARGGINTVDDLLGKTARQLLDIKNFGEGSLQELEAEMAVYGLKLRTVLYPNGGER